MRLSWLSCYKIWKCAVAARRTACVNLVGFWQNTSENNLSVWINTNVWRKYSNRILKSKGFEPGLSPKRPQQMNLRRKAEAHFGCISLPVQEPDLGRVREGEIAVKQQEEKSEETSNLKMSSLTAHCWAWVIQICLRNFNHNYMVINMCKVP